MLDWSFATFLALVVAALRGATPLILASMGGLLSERSGVIQIALEGLMLIGAFAAAAAAYSTGSGAAGLLAAAASGGLLAALYAAFVIPLRGNQIVVGTAINLLAAGLCPVFGKIFFDSTGQTPSLSIEQRFEVLPVFLAWLAVAVVGWTMHRTRVGLWISFSGENPDALESAGIRVLRVRWSAVVMSGVLAGLAGASLSMGLASAFTRNMTAGRGFMALAALIFGKWKPIPTALACVFFGFTDALQGVLQGVELPGIGIAPVQWIQILPYLITIAVLAGFVGRARAPKSLGLPWPSR